MRETTVMVPRRLRKPSLRWRLGRVGALVGQVGVLVGRVGALVGRVDRTFLFVLLGSFVAHAVFVILLHATPRPPSAVQPHAQRPPPKAVPRPARGEPKTPIVWGYDAEVNGNVRVRSLAPLAAVELDTIRTVYERARALFPAFAGRAPMAVGDLDIRLLPLDMLNDASYFDVEPDELVLGWYFPGGNITYLTPTAFSSTDHLVHELAHHFTDEYGILDSATEEEVKARRFERFYARFEELLGTAHVLPEPAPSLPAWERVATTTVVDAGLTVRSRRLVPPPRVGWLRETVRISAALFCVGTGVGDDAVAPLEIRLVDAATLNNPRLFPGAGGHRRDGVYYPEDRVLVTTARVLVDAELLGHFLAHHLAANAALEPEELERVAYGFAWDLDHKLLHEVAKLGPNPLGAPRNVVEDPVRLRSRAAVVLARLDRPLRAFPQALVTHDDCDSEDCTRPRARVVSGDP
jgi:hypothetical protein